MSKLLSSETPVGTGVRPVAPASAVEAANGKGKSPTTTAVWQTREEPEQ
jgi:hypothetical protein